MSNRTQKRSYLLLSGLMTLAFLPLRLLESTRQGVLTKKGAVSQIGQILR